MLGESSPLLLCSDSFGLFASSHEKIFTCLSENVLCGSSIILFAGMEKCSKPSSIDIKFLYLSNVIKFYLMKVKYKMNYK